MKKLVGILAIATLLSCSNDDKNCDAELDALLKQREQGIAYANGNFQAILKIQQEYERKKLEIEKNCN